MFQHFKTKSARAAKPDLSDVKLFHYQLEILFENESTISIGLVSLWVAGSYVILTTRTCFLPGQEYV